MDITRSGICLDHRNHNPLTAPALRYKLQSYRATALSGKLRSYRATAMILDRSDQVEPHSSSRCNPRQPFQVHACTRLASELSGQLYRNVKIERTCHDIYLYTVAVTHVLSHFSIAFPVYMVGTSRSWRASSVLCGSSMLCRSRSDRYTIPRYAIKCQHGHAQNQSCRLHAHFVASWRVIISTSRPCVRSFQLYLYPIPIHC